MRADHDQRRGAGADKEPLHAAVPDHEPEEPCDRGRHGQHEPHGLVRQTEIAQADVTELMQLFDSVEAKQYKRPDMNGDLRLVWASPVCTEYSRALTTRPEGDALVLSALCGEPGQRGPRRVRAGVLGPQRSGGVRKLNFYHQVQLRRQHLPAAQNAHHGGAQHVRVAALVHRAGDARVVHFVETLHGLVAVVLSALQQVVRGHGAAVVVDVVAALAVGEDLDALDEAGGVGRGRGQRVGAVRVPDAEGDLDGLGVDEGRAGLRLGRLRRNKVEEFDGDHTVERRHGDGHARLLSPHQRAVGGAQGLPGPAGRT